MSRLLLPGSQDLGVEIKLIFAVNVFPLIYLKINNSGLLIVHDVCKDLIFV